MFGDLRSSNVLGSGASMLEDSRDMICAFIRQQTQGWYFRCRLQRNVKRLKKVEMDSTRRKMVYTNGECAG